MSDSTASGTGLNPLYAGHIFKRRPSAQTTALIDTDAAIDHDA